MRPFYASLVGLLLCALPLSGAASADLGKSLGETIYIPAYSRIFSYLNRPELLAATLTVHNVDPQTPVTLERIDYYGEDGKPLNSMLDTPVDLEPFESASFLVPINDTTGGVGANFIAQWRSDAPALSPLAEAVMIGAPGSPGPSFTSRGRVISRTSTSE